MRAKTKAHESASATSLLLRVYESSRAVGTCQCAFCCEYIGIDAVDVYNVHFAVQHRHTKRCKDWTTTSSNSAST